MNIQEQYSIYINTISSKGHAGSLELALFIFNYCKENKPTRILDMGSGFISSVIRSYASESTESVDIVSVDDNQGWLSKSKDYSESVIPTLTNGSTHEFITYDHFKSRSFDTFDLVFYDFGSIPTRIENIQMPFDHSHNTVILDDAHYGIIPGKPGPYQHIHESQPLNECIYKTAETNNFAIVSLRDETIDEYGRFSLMAVKQ